MLRRAGIFVQNLDVSIHAHQYWRAMRRADRADHGRCNVSIHAHQYWRAMRHIRMLCNNRERVSIHAHQYWRAMQPGQEPAAMAQQFQSTPTNTGGRCS